MKWVAAALAVALLISLALLKQANDAAADWQRQCEQSVSHYDAMLSGR